MKIFFRLDADGRGRECSTSEIYAAWWECLDDACSCEGHLVRHGEMPSMDERREAEYVESENLTSPYPDNH